MKLFVPRQKWVWAAQFLGEPICGGVVCEDSNTSSNVVFLCVRNGAREVRVPLGGWLVYGENDDCWVCTDANFRDRFEVLVERAELPGSFELMPSSPLGNYDFSEKVFA